ncbi:MAG: hypothetical protein K2H64_05835, partial [Desulfovibrio sp.]|nr:hypothetical protein [Desulfovibrio sp.]
MAPSIPDATAPFNFIPYEPKTVLDDWEDEPGRWSGTIKCSLTALSPLLVANVHTRREDDSTDCEFMKIDGTPVIPGSSIKGMLRSLAEILSFSKLAPVSRDPIFYRNVTDNKVYLPGFAERLPGFEESVMGGFLRRDGVDYWLIPVAVDPVPGNSSMEKDHKNYLRTGANFTGYVTTGGFPEGCHKTAYKFPKPGPSANKIKLRREVYDNFEAQLTESQRKRWNKERLTGPGFGHPVFYRVENGEIAEIGLARFFRRKYRNAAADLTGDADGAKDFCSRLFGRVGKNRDGKTETRKGKAAVGPAFVEGKEMTPREV